MKKNLVGGSFAPPLTDALLASYKAEIASMPAGRLREGLEKCLVCCEKWWALPEPNGTGTRPHPTGRATVVDLHPDHAEALFDLIPWSARSNGTGQPDELDAIHAAFDAIPDGDKALRDMAFHLLWHVRELDLDREPLTKDKL